MVLPPGLPPGTDIAVEYIKYEEACARREAEEKNQGMSKWAANRAAQAKEANGLAEVARILCNDVKRWMIQAADEKARREEVEKECESVEALCTRRKKKKKRGDGRKRKRAAGRQAEEAGVQG